MSTPPTAPDAPALLSAIVRSSDDAIISKDLNGVITSWNPAAERMFGYTPDEAIGRNITMVIPEDRRAEETLVLSRIRAGQSVDHFQTVRRRKDGGLIHVSLTVSPVHAANGTIVGASKIARDITEQKRLADELEHANRIKDEFLATLSHELRTPLHAILGYTQILRQDTLDDDKRHGALQIIERNTRALSQIVSDLLDVSRIVSGKMQLETQRCDLAPSSARIDAAADLRPKSVGWKAWACRVIVRRRSGAASADHLEPAGQRREVHACRRTGPDRVDHGGQAELTVADSRTDRAGLPATPVRTPPPGRQPGRRYADSASVSPPSGISSSCTAARFRGSGGQAARHVRVSALWCRSTPECRRPSPCPGAASYAGRLTQVTVLAIDDDADSLQLLDDILRVRGAALCARSASAGLRMMDLHAGRDRVRHHLPGRDGLTSSARCGAGGVPRRRRPGRGPDGLRPARRSPARARCRIPDASRQTDRSGRADCRH